MRKISVRIVAVSILLIIIVLGFNGWLNVVSLKKNYVDSIAANFAVAGGETKRIIEYAVKYGKPLDNFYGIKEVLAQNKKFVQQIEDVRIINPGGKIIYSLQEETEGNVLSDKLKIQADFSTKLRDQTYKIGNEMEKYYIFMPIMDKEGTWIGTLAMVFDKAVIDDKISVFLQLTFKTMLLVSFCASLLLIYLLRKNSILDEKNQIDKKQLIFIFAVLLGISQVLFGYINNNNFKEFYTQIAKKNTAITADIVSNDINKVINRGADYSQLTGLGAWLTNVIRSVPEIDSIYVSDTQNNILYKTTISNNSTENIPEEYKYVRELIADQTGIDYKLNMVLSQQYLDKRAQDLLIDTVTVAFISFFFMIEMIMWLMLFLNIEAENSENRLDYDRQVNSIRSVAFLFFLATDMSISFIPMQMKNLYTPMLGLSQSTIISLPISVEMLCAGVTTFSTGFIIDKKGWRIPFFIGLVIVGIGALLSGLAASALVFILARGIVGIGYGFAWMSMRGYVANLQSSSARAKGFSELSAGIYAGNICACSLGAMLAERIDYSGVFFVAAAILLLVGILANFFVKDNQKKEEPIQYMVVEKKGAFFKDASLQRLLFLLTIPSALCLTGFLNYFFPIYSNDMGMAAANIGRAFMIYGMSIVYLGPLIGKKIANESNLRILLPIASAIGGVAMLVFYVKGGIIAAMLAIFLFGIADSIGFIAQNAFLLNLPVTHAFGQGKALGIFSMTKKFGQMLGPLVIAWGLGYGATQQGIGLIGLIYLVLIIVFVYYQNSSKLQRDIK